MSDDDWDAGNPGYGPEDEDLDDGNFYLVQSEGDGWEGFVAVIVAIIAVAVIIVLFIFSIIGIVDTSLNYQPPVIDRG